MFFIVLITAMITFILTVVGLKLVSRLFISMTARKNVESKVNIADPNLICKIIDASFTMAKNEKVTMVWENDLHHQSLLKRMRTRNQNTIEFQKYNYPRAFLFQGIITYLKKTEDIDRALMFKDIFNQYIDEVGNPIFVINRIDQAPFGVVALYLYKMFGEEKYLTFSNRMFEYIRNNVDEKNNILDYRPNLEVVLNDMLGLTIPFLNEYYTTTANTEAIKLAEQQLDYFIQYGVDPYTKIPSHGIDKNSKVKVGSSNWGRGIGWYFIGLSFCAKHNKKYDDHFQQMKQTVLKLKNKEDLWTQFPGSSSTFDASTTLMFIYAIMLNDKCFIKQEQFFYSIKNYISSDGIILQTSGDTFGLNEYSSAFGKSELSQGLLLLVLSEFM